MPHAVPCYLSLQRASVKVTTGRTRHAQLHISVVPTAYRPPPLFIVKSNSIYTEICLLIIQITENDRLYSFPNCPQSANVISKIEMT